MTMEMFCQRVPLGGKMLYKDFQLRLSMAMYGDSNNNQCWKFPQDVMEIPDKIELWPKKTKRWKFIQETSDI